VLIAGQVSSAAWKYLQSRGAELEERDELVHIHLPGEADLQYWNWDEASHISAWSITFDDDQAEDKQHVIFEIEPRAYESRVYALAI